MNVDSENSCVLLPPPDSRTSCVFQAADEKDEIPGVGEERYLLRTWSFWLELQAPQTLLFLFLHVHVPLASASVTQVDLTRRWFPLGQP